MSRLRTLAAVAAAALALRARAVEISGALGAGYSRSDSWSAGAHEKVSTWDWDASATASGEPFRPGLLRWLVGGEYRTLHTLYFETADRADELSYQGQLSLFDDSVLPLSFSASRGRTEFSSSDKSAIGSSLVTNWNGTALFHPDRLPALRLAFTDSQIENHSLGAPEVRSDSKLFTASASQSLPKLDYEVDYNGSWNQGTIGVMDYRSHQVTAQATSGLGDGVLLHVSENYYLRDPTRDDPTNPRFDDSVTGIGLQWRTTNSVSSVNYGYSHLLVDAPAGIHTEEVLNSVVQNTRYNLSRDLAITENATLLYSREQLGANGLRSFSESVGSGVIWQHRITPHLSVNLGGGGSVGEYEPAGEAAVLGYGLAGSGGVYFTADRLRANASYTGTLQQAAGVRTVDQRANMEVERLIGHLYLDALSTLSMTTREDPLLGTSRTRSAIATLTGRRGRYGAQLSVGITDGTSPALANPVSAEPFLPVSFNTTTAFATLSSTCAFRNGLSLNALARTMEVSAPGQPSQYEHAFSVTAEYDVGAFMLSVLDQYSIGGAGGLQQRGNIFMVRAVRNFGMSF